MLKETTIRIISAILLFMLMFAALTVQSYNWILLFITLSAFGYLGLYEFYQLSSRNRNERPLVLVGYIFAGLLLLTFYANFISSKSAAVNGSGSLLSPLSSPLHLLILPLFALFIITILITNLLTRELKGTIYSSSITAMGVLYTIIPVGHIFLMLELDDGLFLLLYITFITFITDSGAYFSGKLFGKRPARVKASPGKTIEGFLGGIILATLLTQLFLYICIKSFELSYYPGWVESAVLSFILSIITILGDLVESTFKRDADCKDSAKLIPGHGGILDLVDSLLITIPLGYYYFFFKSIL